MMNHLTQGYSYPRSFRATNTVVNTAPFYYHTFSSEVEVGLEVLVKYAEFYLEGLLRGVGKSYREVVFVPQDALEAHTFGRPFYITEEIHGEGYIVYEIEVSFEVGVRNNRIVKDFHGITEERK